MARAFITYGRGKPTGVVFGIFETGGRTRAPRDFEEIERAPVVFLSPDIVRRIRRTLTVVVVVVVVASFVNKTKMTCY